MKRRTFLNNLALIGWILPDLYRTDVKKKSQNTCMKEMQKNWIWLRPAGQLSLDELKKEFSRLKLSGIDAVLALCYDGRYAYYGSQVVPVKSRFLEEILPLAKSHDLEVHAWIFSLICNMDSIIESHQDWFNINRDLKSSCAEPPYVGYYRWLCPSHPEVVQFVQNIVTELCQYSELAGIQLDYIRYPDVILPKRLQGKYGLVQDRELPEFDFCYCDICRKNFEAISNKDPLNLESPENDLDWRSFREQKISSLVSKFAGIVRKENKTISAAVFATPTLAKKYVRQDWSNWDLDAVFPMIYHNFYDQEVKWIEQATKEGKMALSDRMALYSGVFIPSILAEDLHAVLKRVRAGGADGISFYSWNAMTAAHWQVLGEK